MADIETSHIHTSPEQAVETSSALDALFKQATDDSPETPAPAVVEPAAKPEPKVDPAVTAPAKVEPAVVAEPKVEPKETPVVPAPVKDALDEVQLPPYSKPKTGEAFAKVKSLARETISKKDLEIERLNKELLAREEKLKAAPTEEQRQQSEQERKELEELRNFRRVADIENDPSFKAEYEGKIESNNNLILSKLAEAGLSAENLEAAKKFGVENVDWEPILANVNPALRHLISAKLGQNIELRDARVAAVQAARKEPGKFESQRIEAQARTLTETTNSFLKKMPWAAEKEIPAAATPEQKAELEAHNATAKKTTGIIQSALKDYSPETFAELAVGTAAAHKYKADFESLKASSEAATTKLKTDLSTITKERDTLKTELDAIKKAGRTHVRGGSKPSPASDDIFVSGADALDRLRAEAV